MSGSSTLRRVVACDALSGQSTAGRPLSVRSGRLRPRRRCVLGTSTRFTGQRRTSNGGGLVVLVPAVRAEQGIRRRVHGAVRCTKRVSTGGRHVASSTVQPGLDFWWPSSAGRSCLRLALCTGSGKRCSPDDRRQHKGCPVSGKCGSGVANNSSAGTRVALAEVWIWSSCPTGRRSRHSFSPRR